VEDARGIKCCDFFWWLAWTNNKLFAVLWESLKYNLGNYILKVDKSVLKEAEDLDEEVWTLNYNKLLTVYKHCGFQPYWK